MNELKIEELSHDLEEEKNRHLRTLADFDNYRKRTERDAEAKLNRAKKEILLDLLVFLDYFDQARKQVQEPAAATGIDIMARQFNEFLYKHGVRAVECLGQPFDPEEHEGIEADLTLIGKALSGGFYPISAVLSNTEVMDVLQPGEHGSTFGGNPLACAVARTALKVLIEENMIENAEKMGIYFLNGLKEIESSIIKEVRGKGLMIGVELYPHNGGARKYCEKLQEKGLLCKETHENIIRFAPPLVITKNEINWALERIESVFK